MRIRLSYTSTNLLRKIEEKRDNSGSNRLKLFYLLWGQSSSGMCVENREEIRKPQSLIKEQNIKSFNGIFEINVPILNEVRSKLNTYNTASLHLNNFCDPNEKHAIDGFLKSDNTDLEFNDKVKQLEDEVAHIKNMMVKYFSLY